MIITLFVPVFSVSVQSSVMALMIRKIPTLLREMSAKEQFTSLRSPGGRRRALGWKREESAAMMVGVRCAHQRAPAARGTKRGAVPKLSCLSGRRAGGGCAGKGWGPQGCLGQRPKRGFPSALARCRPGRPPGHKTPQFQVFLVMGPSGSTSHVSENSFCHLASPQMLLTSRIRSLQWKTR